MPDSLVLLCAVWLFLCVVKFLVSPLLNPDNVQSSFQAYAVVAPIILPITLVYFITSWITWRYCAIHFYEPAYDGGGKVWELLYVLLLWTVWIANFFTGCVFIANQGFWSGGSLMITSTVALLIYAKCMNATLRRHSMATPTQVAAWAPRISHVPRELYMPPPLRRGAVGWFPEHSKIWEKYGIARYSLW